jgi:hypothetical protein
VRKRRCEHATRARRKSALRGLVCCAGESMASRCMQRNHLQQRQSDAARLPVMLDEGEAWHGRTSRSPKDDKISHIFCGWPSQQSVGPSCLWLWACAPR